MSGRPSLTISSSTAATTPGHSRSGLRDVRASIFSTDICQLDLLGHWGQISFLARLCTQGDIVKQSFLDLPKLLMPQRGQRIRPCRAPRWNERRDDHATEHDRQRTGEGDAVGGADAEQHAAQKPLTPSAATIPTPRRSRRAAGRAREIGERSTGPTRRAPCGCRFRACSA